MVKAALLYADEVTLASPKALLMFGIASVLSAKDPAQRRRAMRELLALTPDGADALERFDAVARSDPRARRMRDMQLTQAMNAMALAHEETLKEAGAGDLIPAMEAGLLHIHPLGSDRITDADYWDRLIEELLSVMSESVQATATTYPLFDDSAGGLLRAALEVGTPSEVSFARANEVGIAHNLIGNLDAFPDASVDVVLDVRERMHNSLARFRSAVAEAASELESVAVDPSFRRSVEDIRIRVVAPALLEVQEHLDELGARNTLLHGWSRGGAGAVLSLVAGSAIGASDYVAFAAGGAAVSAPMIAQHLRNRETKLEMRRNGFYFLYETNRELAR